MPSSTAGMYSFGIRPPVMPLTNSIAGAGLLRFQADDHLGVLTGTTGLLLVDVVDLLHRTTKRLAVGHLRLTDIGLDPEFALHPVDHHLEVQLAHAGDDRLAGLLVGMHPEGRILFGQPLDGDRQLLLVRLGLRLDRLLDHRGREVHRLQHDRVVRVATASRRWWCPSDPSRRRSDRRRHSRSPRACWRASGRSCRSVPCAAWCCSSPRAGLEACRSRPGRRSACPGADRRRSCKARAENGSSLSGCRSITTLSSPGLKPSMAGTSVGAGR